MSCLSQNDLQSGETNPGDKKKPDDGPNHASLVIPPDPCKFALLPRETTFTMKEFKIIKLSAQFYAVYDILFLFDLKRAADTKSEFEFLKIREKNYFFGKLAQGYGRVLRQSRKLRKEGPSRATILDGFFNLVRQIVENEDVKGVEKMALSDFPAFEFFVNMEYSTMTDAEVSPQSAQEPLSFPLLPQGISITRNELDVIKLTAQFVAVFGQSIQKDLTDAVPEFESMFQFALPTDWKHDFYSRLVLSYTRVLMRSEHPRNNDTIVKGFACLVHQVLKREEDADVMKMAMIDLRTYEFLVEVEYDDGPVLPSRGYLVMMNRPPPGSLFSHTQVPRGLQRSSQPLLEEPLSKRLKFDKPALVPEDQFLAQNPGPSTIRVSVPNVVDGQVIEIAVESLSEDVAGLKEKIALKLKLSGDAGFLKDNKSLAHYNVGAGEILKLSLMG